MFRRHGREFISRFERSLSVQQRRVIRDVTSCRTKQLAGDVSNSGETAVTSESHTIRAAIVIVRNAKLAFRPSGWRLVSEQLLPVPYFHVVFTLPKPLAALAFQNKKVIYGMLFQAAAETLAEVAENPRHLGARIGFVAILHTWGQNLMHHPHLHCVVPAGGIALDQSRWVPCRQTKGRKPFFLPVRVLSRVFRGKFIHKLKKAYRRRNLVFVNCLSRLAKSPEFSQMIDRVVETDWVVYAKQPFGGRRKS